MKTILYSLVFIGGFSQTTLAQDEDSGYEAIIEELSQTRTNNDYRDVEVDPFSQILIHSGVGWSMTHLNLDRNKDVKPGTLQGVEINLGIDLFSRNWMAEGSYRNYGEEEFKLLRSGFREKISLSEFDLKLIYGDQLNPLIRWKSGMGLAARYMNYTSFDSATATKYTTPSWIMMLGFEAKVTKVISVGAEVDYRTAMIEETIDTSALTTGVRVDAHF